MKISQNYPLLTQTYFYGFVNFFQKSKIFINFQKKWNILQVAKYVRHEKKLPTGDIDELMDLRETWKTEIQKAESESQLAALKEKLKILENDLAEKTQSDLDTRSKLETALKNHDSLKDKLNAEIKVIFRFF